MEIILDNYEDICHLVDTSKREFIKPEHSRQKSFYKKALVFDDGKAKGVGKLYNSSRCSSREFIL
jgi:hypothetical protein